jgi:uridine kinase
MSGAVIGRFGDLARCVLAAPARLGPVRVIAVDGPAGSGKTTFATRLTAALRAAGARVVEVHTDDLLKGWGDIVGFWPRLEKQVLAPLRRGEPAAYRAYDWVAGRFEDRWRAVPVPDVLVLDGVTSAREAIRPELSLAVFVRADDELRLARGLSRDGEALRPQWQRWMADEAAHFAADRTADHADLVVDGAAEPDGDDAFIQVAGGLGCAAAGRSWGTPAERREAG